MGYSTLHWTRCSATAHATNENGELFVPRCCQTLWNYYYSDNDPPCSQKATFIPNYNGKKLYCKKLDTVNTRRWEKHMLPCQIRCISVAAPKRGLPLSSVQSGNQRSTRTGVIQRDLPAILALATQGRCIALTGAHRLQAAAQLSNTILGRWLGSRPCLEVYIRESPHLTAACKTVSQPISSHSSLQTTGSIGGYFIFDFLFGERLVPNLIHYIPYTLNLVAPFARTPPI